MWTKSYCMTTQMKAIEQYFHVVLFIRLHKVVLYNNQINARALIGQSTMGYCAGKPMGKSHVF